MFKPNEYSDTVERNLIVHCPNQFHEALHFSEKNVNNELQELIMQLMTGNYYEAKQLHIGQDFVKHSFIFWFTNGDKVFMNGGIILHGYEETLSVEINPKNGPHYSIHT